MLNECYKDDVVKVFENTLDKQNDKGYALHFCLYGFFACWFLLFCYNNAHGEIYNYYNVNLAAVFFFGGYFFIGVSDLFFNSFIKKTTVV